MSSCERQNIFLCQKETISGAEIEHLYAIIRIINWNLRRKPWQKEVDPKQTKRAMAFELWMGAPNPMVTFFKTLEVTPLVKLGKRKKLKFHMLLDYCIGKAASNIEEFYTLPVGNALVQYDSIAVNTIVKNKDGEISSCDILYTVIL